MWWCGGYGVYVLVNGIDFARQLIRIVQAVQVGCVYIVYAYLYISI